MKKKIRKAVVGVFVAGMVLSIGATSAFTAGPEYGRNFVDADGDGACDYAGTACRYIDSDHDGICDNRGRGKLGYGRNFVDTDADGVCDNYGAREGRGSCGRRNR